MANRTVMAKQLKCIVFTTLVVIVFMIAMPIFIMKPKVSANQVEEITNSNESVEASTKQNNNIIIKGNETVKVYITETGKIEEVNLEDYICGVVSNEMPASFEKEALKAQAVAARTYLASKKLNSCTLDEGIDICDSTHCQVYTSKEKTVGKMGRKLLQIEYWNKIKEAVDETSGQVLSYNGELVLYPTVLFYKFRTD